MLLCIPIMSLLWLRESGHFCTVGSNVTYNHFVLQTMQIGLTVCVKESSAGSDMVSIFFRSLCLKALPLSLSLCLSLFLSLSLALFFWYILFWVIFRWGTNKKPLQNRIIYFKELPWIGPECFLFMMYTVMFTLQIWQVIFWIRLSKCIHYVSTSSTAISNSTFKESLRKHLFIT